jgi:integrase
MPRLPIHKNPSLRRHTASGQGVVTLGGRDHYLGAWPADQSDPPTEVRERYDRAIAEWRANGRRPLTLAVESPTLSVGELILAYWKHAELYYRRPDGTPTREVENIRYALRPLRALYESLLAAEFSPLKLSAVREEMIRAGLARTLINSRVAKIVRVYKWGVAQELVAETVCRALEKVEPLHPGRCAARETAPVGPVGDAHIEAVLPFLLPTVAAMVRLMRLTGARCGEVCAMRACDLDRTGSVWVYRPARHKTSHRGRVRVIALGPRARAIVQPFLRTDPLAPLFSPARAVADWRASQRAARKSKVQPSQVSRRKATRRRPPGQSYTPHSVAVAVRRACDRADRLARQRSEDSRAVVEGRAPVRVPGQVPDFERLVARWHVHQLRHAHATEVRSRCGLDAARTALGHAGAAITELYAERDLAQALHVAAQVG